MEFLLGSSPPAESFTIFEESSLADSVIDQIDSGNHVILMMQDTNDGSDDNLYVRVRLITSSRAVHNTLSSYGPGVFRQVNRQSEQEGYQNQNKLQLNITRIGHTSGDIYFQISGGHERVIDVLRLFLLKTSVDQQFSLKTLVHRDSLINRPPEGYNITFHCPEEPYGLASGNLMEIRSTDVNLIAGWTIRLSLYHLDVHNIEPFLLKFRKPPAPLAEIDQEESVINQDEGQADEHEARSSMENRKTFKLIELTRREITYLIGKKGKKIESIRKTTQAIIKVIPLNQDKNMGAQEFNNPSTRQFLRLSGTSSQIKSALAMIEADIYQFRANGITTY